MKEALTQAIAAAVKRAYNLDIAIELTRPAEQFGDFATNVSLPLAKQTGQQPRAVAENLAVLLREAATELIAEVSVAGPGFLNFKIQDNKLLDALDGTPREVYAGKTIVAEYSDPNPFKVLHAGHLYTSIVGDAIANLIAQAGGAVHRVNFGGDVGLHVGKTLWAMLRALEGPNPAKLQTIEPEKRSEWMADCYVAGNNAYEDDEAAKAEMVSLSKQVYQWHADDDHTTPVALIYWTCRQWSYDYFETFYARIGSKFEKYYPESAVSELGLRTVQEQIGPVFEKSDGAVVFKGELYGLHTRVFINSQGIPTYEAKDIGLIMQKWHDYHFDTSVVITGNEQAQYMAVVLKALEQFAPELAQATVHLTHGIVKLQGGIKMSSRRGNILRATDVLDAAATANKAVHDKDDEPVTLGAVKYAFLKQRLGPDIIYVPEESVSLEGNSGPYLQYAHARARSILAKTEAPTQDLLDLQPDERALVLKMTEYIEVVDKAVSELLPHHICTYLYELAQTFNRFYEHNRVIGDERQAVRVALVSRYAAILQAGLALLGIAAPNTM